MFKTRKKLSSEKIKFYGDPVPPYTHTPYRPSVWNIEWCMEVGWKIGIQNFPARSQFQQIEKGCIHDVDKGKLRCID
jgi:hypothetical protein